MPMWHYNPEDLRQCLYHCDKLSFTKYFIFMFCLIFVGCILKIILILNLQVSFFGILVMQYGCEHRFFGEGGMGFGEWSRGLILLAQLFCITTKNVFSLSWRSYPVLMHDIEILDVLFSCLCEPLSIADIDNGINFRDCGMYSLTYLKKLGLLLNFYFVTMKGAWSIMKHKYSNRMLMSFNKKSVILQFLCRMLAFPICNILHVQCMSSCLLLLFFPFFSQ